MRALRFALGYMVLAVGALPIVITLTLLLPFRSLRIRTVLAGGRWLARAVLWCLGVKVRFAGPDAASLTPAIFVANHTSTLDLFLFAVSAPTGTSVVVKKELIYVPIFGQLAWLSGNLLIDRKNLARAKEGLADISALVKRYGMSLFVMAEGTRSHDGNLQPFKRGFVHLAIATGLPVVPMVYHGARQRWPLGAWSVEPGEVLVELLDPIETSGWSGERAGDIADEVRARFVAALEQDAT